MRWVAPASTSGWSVDDRRREVVVVDPRLHRQLDLPGIATDGGAVLVQDAHLVLEVLHIGGHEVPDVGVLRHDAQGELLAAAADDERWIRLLDRLRLAARLR